MNACGYPYSSKAHKRDAESIAVITKATSEWLRMAFATDFYGDQLTALNELRIHLYRTEAAVRHLESMTKPSKCGTGWELAK
jgi:hypothetical protein